MLVPVSISTEQVRDCHEEAIQFCGAVHTRAGALVVANDCAGKQNICFASGT